MMGSPLRFQLMINSEDQRTFGPCSCCGNMTHRVWGYINDGENTIAAYAVEWTPGHLEQAANFDLVLGKWGEQASALDRKAVALQLHQLESGPAFRVIDAAIRPIAESSLVREALSRQQVIGTPIAELVFEVCDAIFLQDDRISSLRG